MQKVYLGVLSRTTPVTLVQKTELAGGRSQTGMQSQSLSRRYGEPFKWPFRVVLVKAKGLLYPCINQSLDTDEHKRGGITLS